MTAINDPLLTIPSWCSKPIPDQFRTILLSQLLDKVETKLLAIQQIERIQYGNLSL